VCGTARRPIAAAGDGAAYVGAMSDAPLTPETINAAIRAEWPDTVMRCVEIGTDYAVAAYDVVAENIRPGGFVSGPTQFGLVDAALWYMSFVALGRIEPMALTTELSIRFLRPAQGAQVFCKATLESVNRRQVVGTGRVWCDDRTDKITATAQGTYALPLPR
jgi:acyl-coenzyme A thioesterase PaaI-like protein